jgi:hypothetical protein
MDSNQTRIEAQHRVLLIVWVFLFLSVLSFFLMAVLIPANAAADNRVMAIVLIGLAFSNLVISFAVKRSFLAKAVAKQDLRLVQQAYIVALALCESAALFGLLIHFATGSVYYYAGFALAIVGMLLHLPKKQHLLDATFKKF